MSTAWLVLLVAGASVLALGGAAFGRWATTNARAGKILATTEIVPGQPFRLEVPAGPSGRALWLRFQLALPHGEMKVYKNHGVIATITIDGRTERYGCGKLAPPDVRAMLGLRVYDERVEGPLDRRLYSATRKVCTLERAAVTVTGSIGVASSNTLVTASVWATGPVSER